MLVDGEGVVGAWRTLLTGRVSWARAAAPVAVHRRRPSSGRHRYIEVQYRIDDIRHTFVARPLLTPARETTMIDVTRRRGPSARGGRCRRRADAVDGMGTRRP